jgi:hypothetical protein
MGRVRGRRRCPGLCKTTPTPNAGQDDPDRTLVERGGWAQQRYTTRRAWPYGTTSTTVPTGAKFHRTPMGPGGMLTQPWVPP